MSHIDPAQWAQLLTALATLLGVIAGLFKSISNGKKADVTAQKIEENTALTKQTHEAIITVDKPEIKS